LLWPVYGHGDEYSSDLASQHVWAPRRAIDLCGMPRVRQFPWPLAPSTENGQYTLAA
jgi:hypothetical protein